MLEFIYYPVSFILWCWHKVFGFILGDGSAVAWILGIMFLTFTIRGIMFKPFVKQVRSMRKMQDFAPEIKKVQKKYANDKQRQAQEMQKLQREHGVNPLGSCLPMLLQIPVFIGLNWVLRAFAYNPDGGQKTENYFFGQAGVESYNNAKIFGVNIGEAIHHVAMMGGVGVGDGGWNWHVAPVAVPLMIAASIATHFTARHSAQRQSATDGNPQAAMMQKLTLWVFPIGLLVFGAFFPIGLLIYFLSNNCWTLMQQRIVYQRIDREEEAKKAEEQEKRSSLGPKPGQKPGQKKAATQGSTGGEAKPASEPDESSDSASSSGTAKPSSGKTSSGKSTSGRTTSGKAGGAKSSGSAGSGTSKTGSGRAAGANKAGANKTGTGRNNASKAGGGNGSATRSSSKAGGSATGNANRGSSANKKTGGGQGSANKNNAGKDGANKNAASGNKNQQTNGSRSGGPSKNAGRKRS